MAKIGRKTVGDLRGRKPSIPSYLFDVYDTFYLLDRDGMSGRAQVGSMRAMLDEIGIEDRVSRLAIIRIWRAMDNEQHRVEKEEKGEK